MSTRTLNHHPISEESLYVCRRAQSQTFRPISPKPCKLGYFKFKRNLAFLRDSAFFTADPLHNLAIIQKSSARQENTLLIYTYEHAHDRLTYQGSLPAGPPHFFSP